MKELIRFIRPPNSWKTSVSVLTGAMFGLIAYLFVISKADSYLSDNPDTCINCHIMAPQYATWNHSAHREKASCNDCHVPHDNVINKYFFKGKDGFGHASAFVMRNEPQVIKIKEASMNVVQQNCIRCHGGLITDSKLMHKTNKFHNEREGRKCWECHRHTPHGRVNSLSSVHNAKVPIPEFVGEIVPEWLKKAINKK